MGAKKHHLFGVRRFRWVVVGEQLPNGRWPCRCDCGTERTLSTQAISDGRSQSCGCLRSELQSERFRKHGATVGRGGPDYRLYQIWAGIIYRCENPAAPPFKYYGGRGIKMCKRWRDSFEAFREDVGPRPGHLTLERIDNDGDYAPGNVSWATRKEQANNRSSSKRITFRGETLTVMQWAERSGIDPFKLYGRIRKGMPMECALLPGDLRR